MATITIAVIGAGTMGQGIAQLALQAGHKTVLIDQSQEQLDKAKASLGKLFNRFVEKGKITAEQADNWLNALTLSTEFSSAQPAGLVIEAIVERMDVKQSVFTTLEAIVDQDALLATNTSSLSVTEIASALKYPERFLGLHFFNPPGIMPLVEVVNVLQTEEKHVAAAEQLMTDWGKKPVRCKDTPSFIVNRVARPFYVESFRLLEEGAIDKESLDACLRSGMNFRMGPCELTDFIGHDVNYAVSQSLWEMLGYPGHLQPSFTQGELVAANYLGRKTGRGYYRYKDGKRVVEGERSTPQFVNFDDSKAPDIEAITSSDNYIGTLENGVVVMETDGYRAMDYQQEYQLPFAVIDISENQTPQTRAIAYSPKAKKLMAGAVPQYRELTENWAVVSDRPGLVNLRVISLIINEGATAVLHGVTDEAGVDSALKGGVNYPKGAFEWIDSIGLLRVIETLDALGDFYGSGRYVPSPYLIDKLEAMLA